MMKLKSGGTRKKGLMIAALILVAVLSVTVFSGYLSSPEFHSGTIQILEEQKAEALALGTAVTVASTALTVLPDDTATPIANKLADLSLPLFLIVSFIYMEIFLLTTFGWVTCTFLIPAVCALAILYIVSQKKIFLVFVQKLAVLSLALLIFIPCSAQVTARVQETFKETIDQKYDAAEQLADENDAKEENTNAVSAFFSGLADNVSGLIEAGKNNLSQMIDAIAVLIITSVIIPLLTLLLFWKVIKIITEGSIPIEYVEQMLSPRRIQRKRREPENKQLSA